MTPTPYPTIDYINPGHSLPLWEGLGFVLIGVVLVWLLQETWRVHRGTERSRKEEDR